MDSLRDPYSDDTIRVYTRMVFNRVLARIYLYIKEDHSYRDDREFAMSVLVISGIFSEKIYEISLLGLLAFGSSLVDNVYFRAFQQLMFGLRVTYRSVDTQNPRLLPSGSPYYT